jgi:putative ABC transport system permease protein
MFDLDKSITAWRRRYEHDPAFTEEDVRELERHVRDQVQTLVSKELSEEEAFLRAMRDMGEHEEVRTAYRNVLWGKRRREQSFLYNLISEAAMLKNYLTIMARHLSRGKGYTTINVASLAAGLACCTLIALYIRDELSYDRFHEHADQTFRLVIERDGQFADHTVAVPHGLEALLREFPEVTAVTEVGDISLGYLSSGQRTHLGEGLVFTDSAFFDVFSFPLAAGDPETVLDAPDAMIITQETADFFFPDEDPIGKVLAMPAGRRIQWTVTGVAASLPHNSHFRFNFLARKPAVYSYDADPNSIGLAIESGDKVYAVLRSESDAVAVETRLAAFVTEQDISPATAVKLSLQSLPDIHLNSHLQDEFEANGDIRYVYLLGVLAVLLLAVAIVNFINLATARYASRAREVGVRKVLGAHRLQLVRQFLGESTLLGLLAGIVALVLALLVISPINAFTGKALYLRATDVIAFFLLALGIGLLAGSYPALFLSGFRPTAVLKGVFRTGRNDLLLRRALVGLQLLTTVAVGAGAAVIYGQLRYLQEARLGFDKERVLVIDGQTRILPHYQAFKTELLRDPVVASVAKGYRPGQSTGGSIVETENGEYWLLHRYSAGYGYLNTLGLQLVEGRWFSPEYADSTDAVILTESAVRRLGLEAPVVGQQLTDLVTRGRGEIIGVVEDFNILSYREAAAPVMISLVPNGIENILIKLRPGDTQAAIQRVETIYEQFLPDNPMIYSFLEDDYDALFRVEHRFGMLFGAFSLITVVVALLGLAGVAAFTAERRTKEIGIRKVLGATVPGLVALLSKDVLKLTVLSSALALPIVYVAASSWLDDFAYRIEIGPGMIATVLLAAVAITMAAVVFQAVKAALANPVKNLRYE